MKEKKTMKFLFDIQLFASSSTKGGSTSQSQSNTTSYSEGGSSTEGGSHSHTESDTHTEGGSHSESYGKSWWSGQVEENTRQHRDAYNTDYEEGAKVTDAYDRLQETLDNKPTFESKYEDKLNSLYESIMNRDKFSYDFNADPMYKLYKDRYTAQGKQAMEDTLGKAQAMNGGYGSSYSQSAGQQTYQNYLQELNDTIPTLRDQAFEQYQYEGQEMLNKYGITADAYDREYGHYRDDVADWQSDRSYYDAAYRDERNFDYDQFANERNYWNNEYWTEKQSETSNYQITDTNYWEDSHTSSDTDTSYWENSSNWNRSNSQTNTSANTSSWSNTNSAGSGGGSSARAKAAGSTASGGNSGNNLNPAPYKTSSALTGSSNEDIQEMVNTYKQMSQTGAGKRMFEYNMKQAGYNDADLEVIQKVADGERYWNGNQANISQEDLADLIKQIEEEEKKKGVFNTGLWR